MQYSFFEKQVDRLRGVYSPGSMNEERKKVLWDRFKTAPDHVFESAVNHLIGEFTTMALPAISRFVEAMGMFRTNSNATVQMQEMQGAFTCNPCRDFGFTFSGDVVVRCEKCGNGKSITGERLAHHQASYDRGRRYLKKPVGSFAPTSSFTPLPYDPGERIVDRSGEW